MKIKAEFDIDIDLNKMLKIYGKEEVGRFYNTNPENHFKEIEKLLKDNVERYCTSIDIKKLEVLKGYFKNGKYIFDEAIFTDIL